MTSPLIKIIALKLLPPDNGWLGSPSGLSPLLGVLRVSMSREGISAVPVPHEHHIPYHVTKTEHLTVVSSSGFRCLWFSLLLRFIDVVAHTSFYFLLLNKMQFSVFITIG